MIRRIVQRDATGCGLACVAMLSKVSYSEAKALAATLGFAPKKRSYYTESWQLRQLLKDLGVRSQRGRRVSHWSSIGSLSIVGINPTVRRGHTYWHWVVYVPGPHGGYVLDPMASIKSSRRTDFGRMRLRSFIPVTRPNNSSKPTPLRGAA